MAPKTLYLTGIITGLGEFAVMGLQTYTRKADAEKSMRWARKHADVKLAVVCPGVDPWAMLLDGGKSVKVVNEAYTQSAFAEFVDTVWTGE